MKTDLITISSTGRKMEKALEQAEKVSSYKGLSGKNALHLRLLTEEMMGMMRAITGETEGTFWIDDEDGIYKLHLVVFTRMDSEKREQLLKASSSGKNESARGLMGMLRDFFDRSADEDVASFTSPMLLSGMHECSSVPEMDWEWSMVKYSDALSSLVKQNDDAAKAAWDELEKSVVAHVADDVKISIKGNQVEMIIYKSIK